MQSSAIIARSNITWFRIWYDIDWGKICIRGYIHKKHPIPCPHGFAMGVSFVSIWVKIDHIITALHSTFGEVIAQLLKPHGFHSQLVIIVSGNGLSRFGLKALPEPLVTNCQIDPWVQNSVSLPFGLSWNFPDTFPDSWDTQSKVRSHMFRCHITPPLIGWVQT